VTFAWGSSLASKTLVVRGFLKRELAATFVAAIS